MHRMRVSFDRQMRIRQPGRSRWQAGPRAALLASRNGAQSRPSWARLERLVSPSGRAIPGEREPCHNELGKHRPTKASTQSLEGCVIGCSLQTEFRRLRHFWLELRPPRRYLAGKPHFRFAPYCFGQMRPKRRHGCFGDMRKAPAVGPLSIKIVRMVGDTGAFIRLPIVDFIFRARGPIKSVQEASLDRNSILRRAPEMRSLSLRCTQRTSGCQSLPAATTMCQRTAVRKPTAIMRRIRPPVSRPKVLSSWEVSRSGSLMRKYLACQRADLIRHR